MERVVANGEPHEQGACTRFAREGDADCQHCSLRSSALFADLHPPAIERFTSRIRNGVLRRGDVLYSAGEAGDVVYTIRVGVVKLVMEIPGRESRIVRLLGRGATLGLEALAGSLYAHTAVALRTTSVCRIPIPTVDTLHLHNPSLVHGLMQKWNEQMVWADRWIGILGAGPVTQRLADLVRLLADISGDSLNEVHLPPVADMAAILGVSAESVSRHMAELKRASLLVHVGPRIYRCDPALFQDANPKGAGGASGQPAANVAG